MSERKFTLLFLYKMKTKIVYKILWILPSLVCITVGGLIYLIFRTRTLVMFHFIPDNLIEELNLVHEYSCANFQIPNFIIYNLPTGLWTISYIILMQLILENNVGLHRFLWIYLLPILLCLTEILQLFSFIPGTFDILDVCCYIVPMIISLLIDIRYEKV